MNKLQKSQLGATLIEVILVMVIGAAIIYLSLQQYLSYRHDADAVQVEQTVDGIFQGMTTYYRTNCFGSMTDPQTFVPGTLYPTQVPGNNKSINIQTDLIDAGYLSQTPIRNPLINFTGAGTINGYVAQFNKVTSNRTYCTDTACSTPATIGTVVSWIAQVAVQLNTTDPLTQRAYLNLLAGDCLSTLSGGIVTPCQPTGNTGNFVVWERLPSFSNTNALPTNWISNPTVTQFKQMYTTLPVQTLVNGIGSSNQYFVCGN